MSQHRLYRARWIHLLLSLLVGLGALLPGRPVYAQSSAIVDRAGGAGERISVTLQADSAPAAGSITTLTFDATPTANAPDLTVYWTLPSGGELLGGTPTETLGTVAANQTVRSTRQVRFSAEGVYKVAVAAVYKPLASAQYSAAGVLFFTVKADGTSSASDRDPNAVSPMHSIMPTTVAVNAQTAGTEQTSDDPCFDVSGQITRIERAATTAGYAADVRVPVRFALVEMSEEDIVFDDVYGEQKTDANGNYSFSFCDDDGVFDDELELYVTLYAELYSGDHYVVMVEDSSYIDENYEFDSITREDSPAGSYTINMTLNEMQSSVFNIADAVFDAWQFWNDSGGAQGDDDIFDYTAEVHWEPGYGDDGSYYNGYTYDEITVADDPSDPDEWDDAVIIHEWAHQSDDNYSCDDNPGGDHFIDQLAGDTELAWGEGYPDYYQSAVRAATGAPNATFYIDINGVDADGLGISRDLENFSPPSAMLFSDFYELAVAAMLWDLNDATNDGQDTVSHGHAMLQEVFTDPAFESNGDVFDDECNAAIYLKSWRDLNKPTDALTAAAITQNIGLSNPFGSLLAADVNNTTAATDELTLFANDNAPNYKWWQQLTMIADRSKSMEGTKFNAVKTVLTEQINDLANTPKGVEFSLYTFDNTNTANQTVLKGQFFADQVTPQVSSQTTNAAADPGCTVRALSAMAQALPGKKGGDAWLFTDGDTVQTSSVEDVTHLLNSHGVKGSFALLGGCGSAPDSAVNVTGGMKKYLGLAANGSQPGGVVPYLLTAIGSGGQFLFVDQSKIGDAADIMRAQLSHSAGAGRWSDYVSDTPTYLYDKLTSWEYKWIDTSQAAGGTYQGTPSDFVAVTLPQPFSFYADGPYPDVRVFQDGYITFNKITLNPSADNTTLPNPAMPNKAMYVLWNDMFWNNPPAVAAAQTTTADAPAATDATANLEAYVYSKTEGDWFAIETNGSGSPSGDQRAYQVLLNANTGEIRYQYQKLLDGDASVATIGIENGAGNAAVQVSYNDASGAANNMGYKFTPTPAQPTKTFTVSVDSLMSGVGFLLTGFSGTFDKLDVRYPDGSSVSCADTANVLCLDLGLVQYVQADVDGRSGVWSATVSAGLTGMGTFAFSSMAASALSVSSPSDRFQSLGAQVLKLNLGTGISGNVLDGWFQRPNGVRFGGGFRFYDDGAHGDGRAGDGEFGSDTFTPPGTGAAYLWVKGNLGGVDFVRTDAAPFTFQPLEVTALGDGVNFGDITPLSFTIKNTDSIAHCYDRTTQVPDGWIYDWHLSQAEQLLGLCLNPGASITKVLDVKMAATSPNSLPSGATGEVVVSFIEREEGQISDSALARVTRYRPAATIAFINDSTSTYLRPTGVDTTTLTVVLLDEQGVNVADGTQVNLSATLGNVTPATGATQAGLVDLVFTAGTTEGDAVITAVAESLIATTTVHIRSPQPDLIELRATPTDLSVAMTSAALVTTVRDHWGNPIANQLVRIGVDQDGQLGTINGSEVMTGTTDANGQLTATFGREPAAVGTVRVRAELLVQTGASIAVALDDQATINLLGETSGEQTLYLPLVVR